MVFELGDPVALKADPSRQGIVVGGPRVTGTLLDGKFNLLMVQGSFNLKDL